jgi:sulfite dehydrogenase (cytochrome) subunit B
MPRILLAAALIVTFPALADDLKPGPGQDATQAGCSTCHTTAYIEMNAPFLTPDAWKAEVGKMRAVFGAPIDDDAAKDILAYLNKNYGPAPKR